MAGLTNFSTHPEHRAVMEEANYKMKMLSQELFFWVKDGITFPCLSYVRDLISESDPTSVNREVVIRDCATKSAEISKLLGNLKSFTPEFTELIRTLGADLFTHRKPWTKLSVILTNLHRT